MLPALRLHLQQQTFPQIPCPHPNRIELHHHSPGFRHQSLRFLSRHRRFALPKLTQQRPCQFLIGRRQIPVFVQVPNHDLRRYPQRFLHRQRAKLPVQMVAQRARLRQKMLERRLVDLFEIRSRPKPRVQVVLKVAAEIDLIEGVFLGPLTFRGDLLDAAFAVAFLSGPLIHRLRRLFNLLEYGILDHLPVDHFLELKLVERKHRNHLHQPRRKDLPLGNFDVQSRLQ